MLSQNMAAENFITIDDREISLKQALGYLRASGDLQQFMTRILRQYAIERELENRTDLEVDPSRVEQAIVDFRLQNNLVPAERFDKWLQSQGLTYSTFREQITSGLKIESLKQEVTASKCEEFFNKNQAKFEQAVLSRIVVGEPALAEDLKRQLDDGAAFETLVKEHSTTGDRVFNGMMGAVSIGQLPEPLRVALDGAEPGDIVGPVEFERRYSLLRLEQRLPVSLEGQVKQNLQNQFFEQWWQQQLKDKTVKLQIE